jgi:hypothetical protein
MVGDHCGNVLYRGYSLKVVYATPQWQVFIGFMLRDKPELSPERQIVRGWDQEEVLKRAKVRIDDLIERQG